MTHASSTLWAFFAVGLCILLASASASAQPVDESHATTEQSCSFGMDKGEPSHTCAVPFPQGCRVANAPGTSTPWTTISKAGRLVCRFDEKRTDWKTKIIGACGRCQSGHCSAQFSVRFDCSAQ
jgi:hypothetical protein